MGFQSDGSWEVHTSLRINKLCAINIYSRFQRYFHEFNSCSKWFVSILLFGSWIYNICKWFFNLSITFGILAVLHDIAKQSREVPDKSVGAVSIFCQANWRGRECAQALFRGRSSPKEALHWTQSFSTYKKQHSSSNLCMKFDVTICFQIWNPKQLMLVLMP